MTLDRIQIGNLITGVAIVLVFSCMAFAHAILVQSSPEANAIVAGPNVTLALIFNSKVDQARSSLVVEASDHLNSRVAVKVDPSAPQKLTGKIAGLAAGAYKLHWQVLAVDGHITRGELPFRVK